MKYSPAHVCGEGWIVNRDNKRQSATRRDHRPHCFARKAAAWDFLSLL